MDTQDTQTRPMGICPRCERKTWDLQALGQICLKETSPGRYCMGRFTAPGPPLPPAMRKCPVCEGRGYYGDGYNCTKCSASGILPL